MTMNVPPNHERWSLSASPSLHVTLDLCQPGEFDILARQYAEEMRLALSEAHGWGQTTDLDILSRAAERAVARPFYLVSALPDEPWANLMDDLGLANREQFLRIALCRRPENRAEVDEIVSRFGGNADRLAEMLAL